MITAQVVTPNQQRQQKPAQSPSLQQNLSSDVETAIKNVVTNVYIEQTDSMKKNGRFFPLPEMSAKGHQLLDQIFAVLPQSEAPTRSGNDQKDAIALTTYLKDKGYFFDSGMAHFEGHYYLSVIFERLGKKSFHSLPETTLRSSLGRSKSFILPSVSNQPIQSVEETIIPEYSAALQTMPIPPIAKLARLMSPGGTAHTSTRVGPGGQHEAIVVLREKRIEEDAAFLGTSFDLMKAIATANEIGNVQFAKFWELNRYDYDTPLGDLPLSRGRVTGTKTGESYSDYVVMKNVPNSWTPMFTLSMTRPNPDYALSKDVFQLTANEFLTKEQISLPTLQQNPFFTSEEIKSGRLTIDDLKKKLKDDLSKEELIRKATMMNFEKFFVQYLSNLPPRR